jgi:halimadienyl-diphosphate synthase
MISTVAALVALNEFGDPAQDAVSIRRGENYLHQNFRFLHQDLCETVGFELILPTLLDKARQLNMSLPYAQCDRYHLIRQKKLQLLPPDLLYSRQISSTYSLEFMGNELDISRTIELQETNGSLGNSPSATAYFLRECRDNPEARRYLAEAVEAGGGVAVPFHPAEIFNKSWVLYNLDLVGFLAHPSDEIKTYLDFLYQAWDPQRGVGFSSQYSVPDLDDTAMTFKLLRLAGYDVDPAVFLSYEKDRHFVCYPYERTPSIGAHVHLLDALRVCPEYEHQPRMVSKALNFCRDELGRYHWFDKWHASPYYVIAHAVIATLNYDNQLAQELVHCIIASQRAVGDWGHYCPTGEETAYCLQALITYHQQVEPLDREILDRAAERLYEYYQAQNYPALWIAKCLYLPQHIVQSAILSALQMYETL